MNNLDYGGVNISLYIGNKIGNSVNAKYSEANKMSGWVYLLLGVFFEVAGTVCLKMANGFNNLIPMTLCFLFFAIALSLIMLSAKTLDVSLVYAVWSGVGVIFITGIGYFYFNEKITITHIVFIFLILIGVVGLKIISTNDQVSEEKEYVHIAK